MLTAASMPSFGQDLVVGVRSGPLSIDPHFNSNGPDTSAARNVFDALLRRAPDFTLMPNLATEWHRVGDNTWEFKLRQDVKWQDGLPFTADDVAFSIDRVPQAMGGTGGFLAYVKSIQQTVVVDDHTVRFVTNGPAATLPAELEEVFIVSKHAVTAAGPDGFRTGKAAIGTGPYRFVSWQPNASEILQRWDGYWGTDKPYWKNVRFTEIPEDAARIAALLSGQVDLINYVAPAGSTAIWPMQAFGGPWAHYAKVLGIPSLQGAAPGHGGRAATSDEFFVIQGAGQVAGLIALERYFVDFIHAFAASAGSRPDGVATS